MIKNMHIKILSTVFLAASTSSVLKKNLEGDMTSPSTIFVTEKSHLLLDYFFLMEGVCVKAHDQLKAIRWNCPCQIMNQSNHY